MFVLVCVCVCLCVCARACACAGVQVKSLFQDQEDLLQDFEDFLPGACDDSCDTADTPPPIPIRCPHPPLDAHTTHPLSLSLLPLSSLRHSHSLSVCRPPPPFLLTPSLLPQAPTDSLSVSLPFHSPAPPPSPLLLALTLYAREYRGAMKKVSGSAGYDEQGRKKTKLGTACGKGAGAMSGGGGHIAASASKAKGQGGGVCVCFPYLL